VRNYLFIFDNNDGRGREVTGQIELSDDDEAFVFGEQVIPEMMHGSGQQYSGCAMELYEGGRIPLENYRKPLSPWHLGVPHSKKLPRHDLDDSCFDITGPGCRPGSPNQGGCREPSRSSFSARPHRIDEVGS